MDSLRLAVPKQSPNVGTAAFFNAGKLRAWLDGLPQANPGKTGQEILAALRQVNRSAAPVTPRFHFLEQCRPLIADICDTLPKQYATTSVPLEDKHRTTAELVHALLSEMAYGYKIVMLATADGMVGDSNRRLLLVASSLGAMHHLAKLLVASYALYLPEPESLWLELHQIYRYADYEAFATSDYPIEGRAGDIRSIDHTYRRIIMLALANPYHLMQGEAQQVFLESDKWAVHCHILPLAAGSSPSGQLYLDLDSDTPPTYAPGSSSKAIYPTDGRLLDISGMPAILEQRIKDVMMTAKTENGQLTLAGRKQRNMYKRLSEVWGIRVERLSERKPRSNPVEIAIGISAVHHFAGHGQEFDPENNEIELRHSKGRGKGSELTLFSENDSPWIHEDQAQRLATGIVQPRTSQFTTDPTKDKDIWVKIYSTQAHFETKKSNAGTPAFKNAECQLHDESRGGMAISCSKGHGIRLVVGEVIAFKSEQAPTPDDWSVGVVRWLRTTTQERLELGVGLLADDTLPVATRGIKGVGKESEYFRSLLIPKMDPTQYPTTLITPAAVYDVESVILINTGTNVFHAQLTRLMDATNSFSLFQFKIVDAPGS